MKAKRQKKLSVKKYAVLGLATLLATAAVVWFINDHHSSQTTPSSASTATPISQDGINYNPPTQQDKQEADTNKSELSKPATEPTPQATAKPVITNAGEYDGSVEASGYVPSVYEDGGACKYTFSLGSKQVSRQTAGFKDVQKTTCPPASVPRSEFAQNGTWKITLTYTSGSVSGTSAEQEIVLN